MTERLDNKTVERIRAVLDQHGYWYSAPLVRAAMDGQGRWRNKEGQWLEVTQAMRENCKYAAREAGLL